MLNLLCFEEIESFLPLLAVPLIFAIIIAIVVTAVIKRVKAEENRSREINEGQAQRTFFDGNGRTAHQSEYLASKRRELAERKITSNDGSHSHRGRQETYAPIVGSLGEVNDEGCDELDGVRLIEHDEAYCDNPDHIISTEPTELERAIVLGEVLNTPRYKQMYRRK